MKSAPPVRLTELPFAVRFWWITLARGLVVLALGIALLAGETTRANIVTFFGVYWILVGLLAIRWALSANRRQLPGLALISGFVGLTTGVVVLARSFFESLFSTDFAIDLVGLTALLVGILRIGGGFRTEPLLTRRWNWDSFLLGIFEVLLGAALLISGADAAWVMEAISAWAIGSGIVLVLDALQLRRAARANPVQTNGTHWKC